MAIERMTLITLRGNRRRLDEVILKCSDYSNFHPQPAVIDSDKIKGFTPLAEENPYSVLLDKIDSVAATTGLAAETVWAEESGLEPEAADRFVEEFQRRLLDLHARRSELSEAIDGQADALAHLRHIEGLDISLDDIFASKFLEVRFGRLPAESFQKLNYYSDRLFIYLSLDADANYNWGVYVTTEEAAPEVDHIFSTLYFERIRIPNYVHGMPDLAKVNLQAQIDEEKTRLSELDRELTALVQQNRERFIRIRNRVRFLSDSFDMRKYVSVAGDQFHIVGFVPSAEARRFADHFAGLTEVDVQLMPVDANKRLIPPTKLKNHPLVRPFEMFVEMYGLPGYHDLDPTPFVAVTFCLLFGIMFGDVGQGLLISLLGWLLWKKKGVKLGLVMNRIGFASCFFGFVYGSVFGYEELLDPLYTNLLGLPGKPVHVMHPDSTGAILGCAVALGAVIILITMVLNIVISLRHRDWGRALFAQNGLAGLVFYGAVLAVAAANLFWDVSLMRPAFTLPFIALPLAVIFFQAPLARLLRRDGHPLFEEGFSAFVTESFFELFEVLLSFATNTMSFLRVGGFALSHAGMMAVVFTLASMVSPAAYPVVVVLGNLFVMGMEGLIVGIQVLRLEFYEMFSRYFDGDGKPFTPISVGLKTQP
jgi:V/A-type H+-transporting ATPase subunit I